MSTHGTAGSEGVVESSEESRRHLLAEGAGVEMRDRISPLHVLACRNIPTEMLGALLDAGVPLEGRGQHGRTPLHCAASKNTAEVVEYLVGRGADVGARDMYGNTALHIAALHNPKTEVLGALLEAGVPLEERGRHDSTPLHCAAWKNTAEVVEYLVGRGADVGARDMHGNTALHIAALHNPRTEVLGVLLEAGAPLNGEGDVGMTPLHFAAQRDTAEVVEYLVGRGADVKATDDRKRTALYCAAATSPSTRVLGVLLDAGASVDVLVGTRVRWTLLHAAVLRNTVEVVEYLVGRGADLEVLDSRQRTPLHNAKSHQRWEVATVLRNSGAEH